MNWKFWYMWNEAEPMGCRHPWWCVQYHEYGWTCFDCFDPMSPMFCCRRISQYLISIGLKRIVFYADTGITTNNYLLYVDLTLTWPSGSDVSANVKSTVRQYVAVLSRAVFSWQCSRVIQPMLDHHWLLLDNRVRRWININLTSSERLALHAWLQLPLAWRPVLMYHSFRFIFELFRYWVWLPDGSDVFHRGLCVYSAPNCSKAWFDHCLRYMYCALNKEPLKSLNKSTASFYRNIAMLGQKST